MKAYDAKYRFEARARWSKNTRIAIGKKDGLISVEVDDESPQRAADMANAYVDELRRMTSVLAVSEAQQRRVFFDKELKDAQRPADQGAAGACRPAASTWAHCAPNHGPPPTAMRG